MYGKSCKEDSFQFSRCLPNTFAYGRMHFTSHILADGGGVVVLQLVNSNCKSQKSTQHAQWISNEIEKKTLNGIFVG